MAKAKKNPPRNTKH